MWKMTRRCNIHGSGIMLTLLSNHLSIAFHLIVHLRSSPHPTNSITCGTSTSLCRPFFTDLTSSLDPSFQSWRPADLRQGERSLGYLLDHVSRDSKEPCLACPSEQGLKGALSRLSKESGTVHGQRVQAQLYRLHCLDISVPESGIKNCQRECTSQIIFSAVFVWHKTATSVWIQARFQSRGGGRSVCL